MTTDKDRQVAEAREAEQAAKAERDEARAALQQTQVAYAQLHHECSALRAQRNAAQDEAAKAIAMASTMKAGFEASQAQVDTLMGGAAGARAN